MEDLVKHNLNNNPNQTTFKNTLLLDVSRRHMSKEEIIDLLTNVNPNIFQQVQLHLTDNEGFSININSILMSPVFDGDTNGWLSIEDIVEIVSVATKLGISIIIDIDVPAHSKALIKDIKKITNINFYMDDNTLDYTNEWTQQLLVNIFSFVSSGLATLPVNYFLGFDEIPGNVANANDLSNLLNRIYNVVSNGKNTISIWNDSLNSSIIPKLNKNINIVYWRDADGNTFRDLLKSNNKIINAFEDDYYFNCSDINNTDYIDSRLKSFDLNVSNLVALWGENSLQGLTNDNLCSFITRLCDSLSNKETIYDSLNIPLLKGYTDNTGFHDSLTDVSTDFIQVNNKDTYDVSFKGTYPQDGIVRILLYDNNKAFIENYYEQRNLDPNGTVELTNLPDNTAYIRITRYTAANEGNDNDRIIVTQYTK